MRPSLRLLALAGVFALTSACATTPKPDVGVRDGFESIPIASVSIAPSYSTSSFGMTPEALAATLSGTEERAAAYLASRGITVVSSSELKSSLEAAGAWKRFSEGAPSTRALEDAFEPDRSGTEPVETATLRELSAQGALPEQPILFLELVYYTEAVCLERADAAAPKAIVRMRDGVPQEFPHPCIVGHLHARLVEHSSGKTMWFNRVLLEDHIPAVDDPARSALLDTLVETLLWGDDGIGSQANPS